MKKTKIKKQKKSPHIDKIRIPYASIPQRIKAFIVDMFMVMMPILYITTYVILDGKESYVHNDFAKILAAAAYGLIIIIFWTRTGQSPGMKAYDIKLIDNKTTQTPSFVVNMTRYIFFMLSAASLIGVLIAFFRKDKKTLHDLLSATTIICKI